MNDLQTIDSLDATLPFFPVAAPCETRKDSDEASPVPDPVLREERTGERTEEQIGPYRLIEKLGEGGMGVVYKAEHLLFERTCAVKFIRPRDHRDPEAQAQFDREVRATARLTHWNTVEIFDYGCTDDGIFYYVMELLPGLSLDQLVKKHGPLPPERAVHFLQQICDALREAHGIGLIHRDVKPANIIAAKAGGAHDVAKLLDFGLAKQRDAGETEDGGPASEGTFSGSPLFMSPEQAMAYEEVDARSDIYSLGAVAYFLLTGHPPFTGRDVYGVVLAHACDEVTPPSHWRPDVPADVEQVVLRCLAKDPNARFPDVKSLKRALAECECAGRWTQQQASSWWQDVELQQQDVTAA